MDSRNPEMKLSSDEQEEVDVWLQERTLPFSLNPAVEGYPPLPGSARSARPCALGCVWLRLQPDEDAGEGEHGGEGNV
jgi:hypothetical protein